MPARTVFRCTDGYTCDLAVTPDGWVLAAAGLPAVDEQFVRNMDRSREWEDIRARLHPGRSYAEWGEAVAGTAATLQLIVQRGGRTTTVATATAEQFSGVAVVGGGDPAYLWTAYDGEQWSIILRQGGEQQVLYRGAAVALGPALVRDDTGHPLVRLDQPHRHDRYRPPHPCRVLRHLHPAGALAEPHAGGRRRRGLFRAPRR